MTPAAASSPAQTLAWAGDGAAHLRGLMTRMGDDAFAAPSLLPGWSRAHVLTHVARHADAMINLLTWARTGVPTPAYSSRERRDAEIEEGASRSPAAIRDDVAASSDRLAAAVRGMPQQAWRAQVTNVQGAPMPATDIPWFRAREMWIHAVDLDVGAAFADIPAPMLTRLLDDAAAKIGADPACPALRLLATDRDRTWTLGSGEGPDLCGTTDALAAWLLGRDRGRHLRMSNGHRPPAPPRWL